MIRDTGYEGRSKKRKVSNNIMHGNGKAFTPSVEMHMETCAVVGSEAGILKSQSCTSLEATGMEPMSREHLEAIELVKTLQSKIAAMDQTYGRSGFNEDNTSDQTEFGFVSKPVSEAMLLANALVPEEVTLVSDEAEVQPTGEIQQSMIMGDFSLMSENTLQPMSEKKTDQEMTLLKSSPTQVGKEDLIQGAIKTVQPRGRPRKTPKCNT